METELNQLQTSTGCWLYVDPEFVKAAFELFDVQGVAVESGVDGVGAKIIPVWGDEQAIRALTNGLVKALAAATPETRQAVGL